MPTGGRYPRHLGKFGPGWLLDSACGRDRTKEHMANSLRVGCEDEAWVGTPNSTHQKNVILIKDVLFTFKALG